ncbi:major capsid protein [Salicola phage SCTP-2]|nr:major capsid protein [Salicola phage SCTP-2]
MANLFENQKAWDTVKQGLSEGLEGKKKENFEVVLENTRKHMLKESATFGATSSGNIATLNKVILPIMRRVMPNVIANEILGVQPLPGPVAQIHTMRYVYSENHAGVTPGTEALSPFEVARAYSGNGDVNDPKAAPTANLEGQPGKRLAVNLVKQTAEAKTRRLSARWTVEAEQDSESQFGLDLESEIMAGLAQEITAEIDQEMLGRLRNLARTGATYDMSDDSSFTGTPTFVGDRHAVLATLMNQQANLVAQRTRRGRANWAVVSPMALTILQSATTSTFARTTEGPFDDPDNQKLVGTLNQNMKVYSDTYASEDTPVLLGYKGQNEFDAGAYFCPYVPLTATQVMTDPNTFEQVVGFMTRYAYVELSNSASSFGNAADYVSKIEIPSDSLKYI